MSRVEKRIEKIVLGADFLYSTKKVTDRKASHAR